MIILSGVTHVVQASSAAKTQKDKDMIEDLKSEFRRAVHRQQAAAAFQGGANMLHTQPATRKLDGEGVSPPAQRLRDIRQQFNDNFQDLQALCSMLEGRLPEV